MILDVRFNALALFQYGCAVFAALVHGMSVLLSVPFVLSFIHRLISTCHSRLNPLRALYHPARWVVETLPNPTLTLVEVSVSYCPLVT